MRPAPWLDEILGDLETGLTHPALLAALAALALLGPARSLARGMPCCSQERTTSLDERALVAGAELFRLENGRWPAQLDELVPRYAKSIHADAWGRGYFLYSGAGGVAVVSAGPDGELGTGDDIIHLSGK